MASGGGGGNSMDRHKLGEKVYTRKSFKGLKTSNTPLENTQNLTTQTLNFSEDSPFSKLQGIGHDDAQNVGLSSLRSETLISISTAFKSKKERHELRRKLESELNLVRNWVKKIDQNSKLTVTEGIHGGKLKRVHSEVGSVGGAESRPLEPLSLPVMENSLGASDNIDRDKRTPKANQLYQNSEFVLGKERMPTSAQNKSKVKGKRGGGEFASGFETGSKVFKSCTALLDKLMKHKHGWVFNSPVDVEGLGLHDYFSIIKHPMDLGTIKLRLNSNHYQTPKEFAEDVKLTFQNALTYNPEGHDVNGMAKLLLKIFEDRWVAIEADYLRKLRIPAEHDAGLPTPTSKMVPPPPPSPPAPPQPPSSPSPPPPPSVASARALDGSEPMANPGGSKAKVSSNSASVRTPHAKKPRARDPIKRDMTFEEKQKLSTSLQSLPSEKLDNVVQIIKKRNPSLCQNDDEIEVDIDSFDTETLWELDRFVANYKKNLSKLKRRAEMEQGKPGADPILLEKSGAPSLPEEPKENRAVVEEGIHLSSLVQKKMGEPNVSSSSTSGSGSSSSGSDSDNSSS